MQSKPGPMLAIDAGTLILIAGAPMPDCPDKPGLSAVSSTDCPDNPKCSQLQDLSECARVSVHFYRRFYVFQCCVGVFEPRAREHHHHGRILLDAALLDEP